MRKLTEGEKGAIVRTIIITGGIALTLLFMIWANSY